MAGLGKPTENFNKTNRKRCGAEMRSVTVAVTALRVLCTAAPNPISALKCNFRTTKRKNAELATTAIFAQQYWPVERIRTLDVRFVASEMNL